MPPEPAPTAREWFEIAEKDLWRARLHLREEDPGFAAHLIQQVIEKGLKGFLISRGWELRKIHNLESLLNDAAALDSSLEKFRPLIETATEYYIAERYPPMGIWQVPAEEVAEQVDQAEAVIRMLRSRAGL